MVLPALRERRQALRSVSIGLSVVGVVLAAMILEIAPGIRLLIGLAPPVGLSLLFLVPTMLAIGAVLLVIVD